MFDRAILEYDHNSHNSHNSHSSHISFNSIIPEERPVSDKASHLIGVISNQLWEALNDWLLITGYWLLNDQKQ